MNPTRPTNLQSFHEFVGKQLESEAAVLMSPEQAVALWREQRESIAAIREGLEDIDAGRTMPLDEFDSDFRSRHGLEAKP